MYISNRYFNSSAVKNGVEIYSASAHHLLRVMVNFRGNFYHGDVQFCRPNPSPRDSEVEEGTGSCNGVRARFSQSVYRSSQREGSHGEVLEK